MKFIFDNRISNRNKDTVISNASVVMAIEKLDLLNSEACTLLTLERDDGVQLNIGGGPSQFVVTWASQDDDCYTLQNEDSASDTEIVLCAGGQVAGFPENIVVSKSVALNAIDSFYLETEKELKWS